MNFCLEQGYRNLKIYEVTHKYKKLEITTPYQPQGIYHQDFEVGVVGNISDYSQG